MALTLLEFLTHLVSLTQCDFLQMSLSPLTYNKCSSLCSAKLTKTNSRVIEGSPVTSVDQNLSSMSPLLANPAWPWDSQPRAVGTLGMEKSGRIEFPLWKWTSTFQNTLKWRLSRHKRCVLAGFKTSFFDSIPMDFDWCDYNYKQNVSTKIFCQCRPFGSFDTLFQPDQLLPLFRYVTGSVSESVSDWWFQIWK